MKKKKTAKISIRMLVEFLLQSGDIDSSFKEAPREVEAIRAHQKIQRSYPAGSRREVTLSYLVETPQIDLKVDGRADGVLTRDGGWTLDEIKTTTGDLDDLTEQTHPVYWAQAKVYAFIYARQNGLDAMGIQVTYYQLDTHETKILRQLFTMSQLEEFFNGLVTQYIHWALRIQNWIEARDASIKQVEFPFPAYRPGQRELAVAVYRTIVGEKNLFAQAPTGIGKTMATLFPAVKAMGEGRLEKIFYLTAKTVTRELAESAAGRMRKRGLKFKTVTLTAKDKICFRPECECKPEECEFAKGHFDRVRGALEDIFDHEAFIRPVIEEYARKHRVCPFEFSLDISNWSDAVICDYNHLFDPFVHLARFFEGPRGDYCFLIDEAHNLVDRARDMFSAELFKAPFLDLKRKTKSALPKLSTVLTKINSEMLKMKKLCEAEEKGFYIQKELYSDVIPILRKFMTVAAAWLAKNKPAAFAEELLNLFFLVREFLVISEYYDERYITYFETAGSDVRIKMFCLDPSYLLGQAIKKGKTAIFFSATLTPLEYFSRILGGSEIDKTLKIPSPFPRENLSLLVADNIKTTFKARELTYDHIVDAVTAMVRPKKGNYLVYLPSYKYQREVSQRFGRQNPDLQIICQTSGMSEQERQDFLARFSAENPETLVGFAVMGGVFGEGIDLVGDRLSGCAVIGVGLPQICLERNIIRDYFDETMNQGFEFAYMYPGMNKVLQAAGRVIRTETDRGVVLLIDERFTGSQYRVLLPPEWFPIPRVRKPEQIAEYLNRFWDKG